MENIPPIIVLSYGHKVGNYSKLFDSPVLTVHGAQDDV